MPPQTRAGGMGRLPHETNISSLLSQIIPKWHATHLLSLICLRRLSSLGPFGPLRYGGQVQKHAPLPREAASCREKVRGALLRSNTTRHPSICRNSPPKEICGRAERGMHACAWLVVSFQSRQSISLPPSGSLDRATADGGSAAAETRQVRDTLEQPRVTEITEGAFRAGTTWFPPVELPFKRFSQTHSP